MEIVVGTKKWSSWSLRPWLALKRTGQPFKETVIELRQAGASEAEIAKHSPSHLVPALKDGDLVVWDSLAICEYANERWLEGHGWPADPRARAVARSAAAEMHSGFAALRAQMPMNVRRQPDHPRRDADAERDIERIQALWRELRTRFGGDGDFLCGGFGIVDAMFAPVCVRFRGYGVRTDDTASAFMDAIFALPPMREWVASARAETERIGFEEV